MRFFIIAIILISNQVQATKFVFRTEPEKVKVTESNIEKKEILNPPKNLQKENNNVFVVLKGAKGAGRTCFSILQDNNSAQDGIYTISPSNIAFNAFCDMKNGGWSLVSSQNETELLGKNIYSINEENFGKKDKTFRVGNEIINSIRPYFSWKITDNSNDIYFNPNCIINWNNSLDNNSNSFCNKGYKDILFKEAISDHTISNYSNGIGMSNEGKFCSIRMYLSRDIFDRNNKTVITKGTAFNCDGNTKGTIRLWFK